ncbi:4Fe-4S dicluster domain-containing protein [Anaeromicropila populeti]|uniref:Carbon-monoxide dehydrogenase iron sulfur subunit n=1 Tax=Anaeromicropila populeti TaxID=37658 RepID=A0A1I6KZW0_9FIRM|nr:4Fe-4S dicluster domain-containing protein [Anaeromicropila populeti]SFR96751.1 carbon-monoxide dehydrogenase iron sulfur subunit [Anaeromicropila populeti]
MKRIMINKDLCYGCLSCSLACMAEHGKEKTTLYHLDLENKENSSRNFIALDSNNKPVPIFCRHCDEPECVDACISGAMTKDKNTGLVTYNQEKCASCYMCIMSCPYGVLKADDSARKIIMKCDFCGENSMPKCVESCPNQAIYLIEVNAI